MFYQFAPAADVYAFVEAVKQGNPVIDPPPIGALVAGFRTIMGKQQSFIHGEIAAMGPLFGEDSYEKLAKEKVFSQRAMVQLLNGLPRENKEILKYLAEFFLEVIQHRQQNFMTLAVVSRGMSWVFFKPVSIGKSDPYMRLVSGPDFE